MSFFPNRTDTTVEQREMVLEDFALQLGYHIERPSKDGPMFACTRYRDGATRGNAGILEATAFVLDVDQEPDWDLLTPYRYSAFTTHSHTPERPRWRIVLFSARPIAPAAWADAWEHVTVHCCPNADPGAKALAQPHYLPSNPPGTTPATRDHAGVLLDWTQLPALPERPQRERRAPGPTRSDRPGDDFNARADWADVLEPAGWTYVRTCRDGTELWRRPGKDEGWSATVNHGGSDLFYPFTSSGEPFEARRSYDKFGAYALLHHAGDHGTAAKALAAKGYGKPAEELRGSPPNAPGPPSANGHTAEQAPRLECSDTANGRRLIAAYGGVLRYNWPWECWQHWDERRWQRDNTGTIYRLAKTVSGLILAEAAAAADDEQKALAKWALASAQQRAIRNMVDLARSEPGVPVTPAELDADPWKLTVPNGTLNLKTGALGPHRREDLITRIAGAVYDADAQCPRFLAFLDRIMGGNTDLVRFLKRAIGSSLTGDTSDRAMFIAWGPGGNGKTTLFDVIRHLLGEYALRTPTDTLLAKRDGAIPNDVARLKGARFVYASEAEEGRRLAESFIKDLTGGDPISARFMRSEWFDFVPECKVWLATNHKPIVRGSDNAIWDRLKLLPFTVTIPLEERRPRRELMAELLAELPGILRWAVEGCLEWQRDGLGEPAAVREATKDYRSAMDVVGDFLADRCVLSPVATVTTKAIYTTYTNWCEANNEKPLGKNLFSTRLAERGFHPTRIGAEQHRGWLGVGLLATQETGQTQRPDTDTTDPHFQVDEDIFSPRKGNRKTTSGVSGASDALPHDGSPRTATPSPVGAELRDKLYPCPGCGKQIPLAWDNCTVCQQARAPGRAADEAAS